MDGGFGGSLAGRAEHAPVAARLKALAARWWPAWLVAYSLNGFYLYLAALDAFGAAPRTPVTAAYYAVLAAAMAVPAWQRRTLLADRLRTSGGAARGTLVFGAALAGWFLLNTALFSDGRLAWRLAALLVLWSLPTALLALALRQEELPGVAHGLVALGLLLVPIELVVAAGASDVFRFTPIAHLDVISAGMVPAIGAVAALSLRPGSRNGRLAQLAAFAILAAATVLPGSRGPVVALVLGAAGVAIVRDRRTNVPALAALAVGLAVGSFAGSHIGSLDYLTSAEGEFSTASIRRQWLEDAVRAVPDKPLLGHGVGMFEDRTPEADRMGVYGQRIYPHNSLVEAAHSLGALGLILYLGFVVSAVVAALRLALREHRPGRPAIALVLGVGAFAVARTNISGEIGTDIAMWTAAALAVALSAEPREQVVILRGR